MSCSLFGLSFLYHAINLMSLRTLSHECDLCFGVQLEVFSLVVITAPRLDVIVRLWVRLATV